MVVIFSENKKEYSKMTLKYSYETLYLDYINLENYILKSFLLPSQYEFKNINLE